MLEFVVLFGSFYGFLLLYALYWDLKQKKGDDDFNDFLGY